jgi:hypothetical protein
MELQVPLWHRNGLSAEWQRTRYSSQGTIAYCSTRGHRLVGVATCAHCPKSAASEFVDADQVGIEHRKASEVARRVVTSRWDFSSGTSTSGNQGALEQLSLWQTQ